MIVRTLAQYARRDAGYYPVITVTGPRQSGKTTLSRMAFPTYEYVSLEDREARVFAKKDPRGFLQRYANEIIIAVSRLSASGGTGPAVKSMW